MRYTTMELLNLYQLFQHQTIASPHPSRKASGTFIIFLPRPSSLYLNRSWLIANIISPDNLGKEKIDPSLYSDATSPFTQQKLCHVVDIARRLKGLDNLCKNEGIHDNIDRVGHTAHRRTHTDLILG